MRSALDHFEDPLRALREAYRVLKPEGSLLIGLAITEKRLQRQTNTLLDRIRVKFKGTGIVGLVRAARKQLASILDSTEFTRRDHHSFRLSHSELRDLLSIAGFVITKEHWQKPPFEFCIYLRARAAKDVKETLDALS